MAQRLTSDADKLARTTPSWKEFQPRVGFSYDLTGDARTVVRGGYGVFHDQLFQNLTLFSLSQSGPEINPRIEKICNAAYPGSSPADPRCVRGVNSRYFDRAFVNAGLPANRLEQINMFTTTNSSKFDSLTTTLRGRVRNSLVSLSYVLANSRSWGGQPTASYSGNAIAIAPDLQFGEGEFGPTRLDERHRFVASAVVAVPWGFQVAPIIQVASLRPYSLNTGFDLDGAGQATIDRLCEGVSAQSVFAARGNATAIRALNPLGCQQVQVNSQRGGFVVLPDGTIEERSRRCVNVDLRITKSVPIGGNMRIKGYVDFYNLFDIESLYFGSNGRLGLSTATSGGTFMQASSLYGPGFGPPVGRPFTAVFGGRFEF